MLTYKQSGVDIEPATHFKKVMIRPRIETAWPGGGKEIGRFAGRGQIPIGAKRIDVSTDGTGTKIILAALLEMFDGIGQDAVAMGAVDTYVAGALPLYLVDTLAVARLEPEKHIKIIESVIRGCLLAGCQLIGGETAQLPGMFKYPWMVNLDVTVIGFHNPDMAFIPLEPRQRVYGWPSYGPASNGFSLLREIFGLTLGEGFFQPLWECFGWQRSVKKARKNLERYWPELESTLAEALLEPTPIWISHAEEARRKGMKFAGHAHITGEGMGGNIPRILNGNENVKVVINRSAWQRPPIFRLAQEVGQISDEEMDRVFNQGIMMISIIPVNGPGLKPPAMLIGEMQKRKPHEPQVELVGKYNDA